MRAAPARRSRQLALLRIAVALSTSFVSCRDAGESTRGSGVANASGRATARAGGGADGGATFVDHQLALRVAQFGAALVPVGAQARGWLAQGGVASHDVEMLANHCYRILAAGGVEVNDMDLALFGADGSELDADTAGADYPSLGTARPICPPSGGRFRIEVRMVGGQGEYGLAVLRTP